MENIKTELEAIFGEGKVTANNSNKKFSINKNVAEEILSQKGNEDLKTLFVLEG
ncbi:MAG: hypothetical protein SFT90_01450 [Rickettsiales bacterium]|nr:hypothetical protein [Rickettsiales bacterium]